MLDMQWRRLNAEGVTCYRYHGDSCATNSDGIDLVQVDQRAFVRAVVDPHGALTSPKLIQATVAVHMSLKIHVILVKVHVRRLMAVRLNAT